MPSLIKYHLLTESEVITGKSFTLAFLALEKKKTGSAFQYPFARARDHWRPCSLNRENPGRAIETRRDSKNSLFENETVFAFITPRSRSNLTLENCF